MKDLNLKLVYKGSGNRGHWKYNEWECVLKYDGKEMVLPSFKFSASEPSGPDFDQVMESLIMDYVCYKDSFDYEGYCEYKGYAMELKETVNGYKNLVIQSKKLENFLGEDIDIFKHMYDVD